MLLGRFSRALNPKWGKAGLIFLAGASRALIYLFFLFSVPPPRCSRDKSAATVRAYQPELSSLPVLRGTFSLFGASSASLIINNEADEAKLRVSFHAGRNKLPRLGVRGPSWHADLPCAAPKSSLSVELGTARVAHLNEDAFLLSGNTPSH